VFSAGKSINPIHYGQRKEVDAFGITGLVTVAHDASVKNAKLIAMHYKRAAAARGILRT
jgi:hypothetical protein